MKKLSLCLILCLALALSGSALAVTATPNQKLAMRSGPSTHYTEPGSMPQNTALTAIEYEEGSGVTWVYIEFWRDGKLDRGYTGLKRMTVNGKIPYAQHLYQTDYMDESCNVYSGPGDYYLSHYYIYDGTEVSVLRYEDGFAFIEYYDEYKDALIRGWVETYQLEGGDDDDYGYNYNSAYAYSSSGSGSSSYGGSSGYNSVDNYSGSSSAAQDIEFYEGTLVQVTGSKSIPMYETPYSGSTVLLYIPAGSILSSYATTSSGHLYVEYGSYEGFVSKYQVTLY